MLPEGVSLLHVEQEVIGDDTPALQAVLDVLEERNELLAELAEMEEKQKNGEDVSSDRLSAIYNRLGDIDADAKPAEAAEILHGLGQGLIDYKFSIGRTVRCINQKFD